MPDILVYFPKGLLYRGCKRELFIHLAIISNINKNQSFPQGTCVYVYVCPSYTMFGYMPDCLEFRYDYI